MTIKHTLCILFCLLLVSPSIAKVTTQEVSYQPGGITLNGYLAYNSEVKKAPAVLVVHEWWGHNNYARERAKMLAKLGFVAFALDM